MSKESEPEIYFDSTRSGNAFCMACGEELTKAVSLGAILICTGCLGSECDKFYKESSSLEDNLAEACDEYCDALTGAAGTPCDDPE